MDSENIKEETQFDISIVLDEIFTNIVNYGYGDKLGYITLNIKLHHDDVQNDESGDKSNFTQLTFTDNAAYFNPLKHTAPTSVDDGELQEGGWGINMDKHGDVFFCLFGTKGTG